MTRVEQINEHVDNLKEARQRWMDDSQGSDIPSTAMTDAIEALNFTLTNGVCPFSHIALNNAAILLMQRYMLWMGGLAVDSKTGAPLQVFWDAMNDLMAARERLNIAAPAPLMSVKACRAQGLTDIQIVNHVYGFASSDGSAYDPAGQGYAGPFLTRGGMIDSDKLERECADQYSVVPKDWVHPSRRARLEAAGLLDNTPAIQMGPKERSREEREAQAIEMMRGGGLMHQTVQVTGLDQTTLTDICDKNEIPLPFQDPQSVQTSSADVEAAISLLIGEGLKDNDIVHKLRQRGMDAVNLGRVKMVRQKSPARPTVPA